MKTNKERSFDCIKMKDHIQAQVYAETKNMSKEELLRYFNGHAEVTVTERGTHEFGFAELQ